MKISSPPNENMVNGRIGGSSPGGKIEPEESPEDALKREIREELATEIEVGNLIN